ncbi:MAG: acetate--CoA ligase family protein [Candidatus Freyarchaeota archaeon]|nr:acetate--CoA ligase family protein [Candidatus Jordarchaeia archaeon]MBS7268708.1 acetate--CoA ligase family protein [Candidatus Jordarchaeia archaeon]MBS7279413.1 acetate--CoA ligase family protein [Candidatus Jordarchaeia archaeon]
MSNNVDQIIQKALSENRTLLLEPEAKEVVKAYGIPVTRYKVAKSLEEAVKYAEEIKYPVVMKIVSRDVVHKSDAGGVKVNLKNAEEVKKAYREIEENVKKAVGNYRFEGMIIQEFAPEGREVIVGMTKDPQFGPALMFGLGGIFVEVLKDVSFRVAPITRYDAEEMIREIKGFPILQGVRGQKPVDMEAIINILLNVSKLVMEHPEIEELDLNPIIAYPDGVKTVDARIILSKQ